LAGGARIIDRLLEGRRSGVERGESVADAIFTVLTVGFFVLAIAYLHGCERLK
jgi:hypothetical protein